jgi:hypothetical protein
MELCKRSLGNRTILYHAADETAKSWLNERIFRSAYMPMEVTMPIEFAPKCLLGWDPDDEAAFYKTMTYPATDYLKDQCPAAVARGWNGRASADLGRTRPFHAQADEGVVPEILSACAHQPVLPPSGRAAHPRCAGSP